MKNQTISIYQSYSSYFLLKLELYLQGTIICYFPGSFGDSFWTISLIKLLTQMQPLYVVLSSCVSHAKWVKKDIKKQNLLCLIELIYSNI